MKQLFAIWTAIALMYANMWAQSKTPQQFLGYELGTRFTPHHRVVAYFEHIAATNKNVLLKYYGTTNELRPLFVVMVSAQEHINNIEQIRTDNLKRTGILSGTPTTKIPITWLSYNVHGNEAVSTEAAMLTLWELVNPANTQTAEWLKKTVIVMDPCLNPDGKDRYSNWYNQKMHRRMQPDPQSAEHNEPWPGGRPNHYLFDLNRDWAWQTQKESQERVKLYSEWMPHIHVDFHEQGVNEPYYFAPAAEPLNKQLSPFQLTFQDSIGRNHARYFDKNNWLYFTKERFDIFYPSYGDSYPMFNGSIGMTYEQGGSGRAGIGVYDALGDTVTLTNRISHHHTSGLSTIEMTARYADKIVDEFAKYFKDNSTNPRGTYKSYVLKAGTSPERLYALLALLDKNGIRYGKAPALTSAKGFHYGSGKSTTFSMTDNDVVISTYQPKAVLVQTLFEPNPELADSITYDITSWALPYAYGVEAFALETKTEPTGDYKKVSANNTNLGKPMAYIAGWNAPVHAKFLSALLTNGIRVRYATEPFEFSGKKYPAGSLIIMQAGNEKIGQFHEKVVASATAYNVQLATTMTGFVDKGKDFGSPDVRPIKAPRIAVVGGAGTSSLNVGEIWFYLEQELQYPFAMLDREQLMGTDLTKYDVLVLPAGNYRAWGEDGEKKLRDWVAQGGKVIAIENAAGFFADKKLFELNTALYGDDKKDKERIDSLASKQERIAPYTQRERTAISSGISGAILEVKMDDTYPLGYGTQGVFYTLKNNEQRFNYLKNGVNAGIIPSMQAHRTGFIGAKAKPSVKEMLVFGVENIGRGQIVYMVDDPIFRCFWENGKLIMSNALFLVGQ